MERIASSAHLRSWFCKITRSSTGIHSFLGVLQHVLDAASQDEGEGRKQHRNCFHMDGLNLELKDYSHIKFFNSQLMAVICTPVQSSFHSTNGFRMTEALTSRAIMQALMDVYVTIKAKVLLAFWTKNTRCWHVSCISKSRPELSSEVHLASLGNQSIV